MKEKIAGEILSSPRDFRLAELRDFLRSRRRALTPQSLGLPARRRWRHPGLRLQDISELAGVSTSWYASFELGYATNISPRTLSAIAGALRLNDAETAYLYQLTGTPQATHIGTSDDATTAGLRRIVEEHRDGFAMLLDRRYDIVAANAAARALGMAGADATGFERNLIWRCFMLPECQRLSSRWRDPQTGHLVAILRRLYAESGGDTQLEAIIRNLRTECPEFSSFWDAQTVATSSSRELHFLLPTDETIDVETVVLTAEGGMRVSYFIPRDDESRTRLHAFVVTCRPTP